MGLATELGRPVMLHCVHAWGDLMAALREASQLPPAIYMHSYSGSAAYATSLLKLKGGKGERIYFGFSAMVNMRSPKARSVIASIPDDRLLLESDVSEAGQMQADCQRMLSAMADAKHWTLMHAAQQTMANACRFYGVENRDVSCHQDTT